MPKYKCSVVGMGKLGLPMAAVHASRGYEVVGIDSNEWLVNELSEGRCPINETGLSKLLEDVKGKLSFTLDYSTAIRDTDVTFIIVPTPSGKDGKFSNDYVLSAVKSIGRELKEKQSYHLVVVVSTVMPGTMENVVKPALEETSGKKCGEGFGLCYSPEFVALGSVIKNMLNPDAILIGESDEKAGDILEGIYKRVCVNNPPVRRTGWWNAEFAKLSLNVYITTKISLANVYAQVCERMTDGDVDAVTGFLGMDSRIGVKYLSGGLAFGGPCFGRDNRALIAFTSDLGIDCPIQSSVERFNQTYTAGIVSRAIKILGNPRNKVVSVLGLTYKPDTDVVEESASLEIVRLLCKAGAEVKVFDPAGMENAKKEFGKLKVIYANSIPLCIKDSDLCILAVPWGIFKTLSYDVFIDLMRQLVVLDCWRMLDGKDLQKAGVEYYAVGVYD